MPRVTRWFVRSAIVYLVAGLVMGVVSVASPLGISIAEWVTFPIYVHLLVVGWVTQLIFGVAYWMFPRYSKEQVYGNMRLAWATYIMLNVGIVLRLFGEPARSSDPDTVWGWLLAASAVLQWLAGLSFVVGIWPRIKER